MLGLAWGTWAAIAAGSAMGGVLRQAVTEIATRVLGAGFPWGTFGVNTTGSAVMGLVAAMAAAGAPEPWSPTARHIVMTGILGGYTTFSSFSIQTLALAHEGQWGLAVANALASVVVSVAACWAGFTFGTGLTR